MRGTQKMLESTRPKKAGSLQGKVSHSPVIAGIQAQSLWVSEERCVYRQHVIEAPKLFSAAVPPTCLECQKSKSRRQGVRTATN